MDNPINYSADDQRWFDAQVPDPRVYAEVQACGDQMREALTISPIELLYLSQMSEPDAWVDENHRQMVENNRQWSRKCDTSERNTYEHRQPTDTPQHGSGVVRAILIMAAVVAIIILREYHDEIAAWLGRVL